MEKTLFQQAAEKIKSFGYRVFVTQSSHGDFGFYSKGRRIGYFQKNLITAGIDLSTESGKTKYRVNGDGDSFTLEGITPEVVAQGVQLAPDWVREPAPEPEWKSLSDFLSRKWCAPMLKEI